MASAIPGLFFCLLLLAPHLGSSTWYTTYTDAGKQHVVLRSLDGPSPSTSCSSTTPSADGAMAVVHRRSPCSHLGASLSQGQPPSTGDIVRRDAQRLRSLFVAEESGLAAAPAPASSSGVTIPAIGTPQDALPGASDYHVVVGYGTPEQRFHVEFDTAVGISMLKCRPCAFGAPCRHGVFDPAGSSSLAAIPCGSPDCPLGGACTSPSCTFSASAHGAVLFNGTYVTDTLTLSPSAAVHDFRFMCMELASAGGTTGFLDLSRDAHSLASRAPSSLDTVAFSYCLPRDLAKQGFLSIGAPRPETSGQAVTYTPLRTSFVHRRLYYVRLVAVNIAGEDVPVQTGPIGGDSLMELHTTFTYLRPTPYAVLRNRFNELMTQYRHAPPEGDLDTCYDFTGLPVISLPFISLRFDGGATLNLGIEEMMYFRDRNAFSVGCLAFAPLPEDVISPVAVIGSFAQASTQVVYDVHGGYVGFVPHRC